MKSLPPVAGSCRKIDIDCDIVAKEREEDSATNPNTTDWNLLEPEFVMFEDLLFYFNEFDEGSLGSDSKPITEIKVQFKGDFIVHQTANSGLYIAQPRRKKWECEGTFTLPGATDDLAELITAQKNNTYLKLKMEFSRVIDGKIRKAIVWIPKVKILMIDDHTGDEHIMSPVIQFRAFKPGDPPAGFPDIDSLIIFQFVNT